MICALARILDQLRLTTSCSKFCQNLVPESTRICPIDILVVGVNTGLDRCRAHWKSYHTRWPNDGMLQAYRSSTGIVCELVEGSRRRKSHDTMRTAVVKSTLERPLRSDRESHEHGSCVFFFCPCHSDLLKSLKKHLKA